MCEGRSDHRDDIDLRKYERKYERMIGRQWFSLNSLNCKMFRGKTNLFHFFLSRCIKNYPTDCTWLQTNNSATSNLQYIKDQDDVMFLSLLFYQTFTVPGFLCYHVQNNNKTRWNLLVVVVSIDLLIVLREFHVCCSMLEINSKEQNEMFAKSLPTEESFKCEESIDDSQCVYHSL